MHNAILKCYYVIKHNTKAVIMCVPGAIPELIKTGANTAINPAVGVPARVKTKAANTLISPAPNPAETLFKSSAPQGPIKL